MKRRLLSIVTALALCLSLLPGTARAEGGTVTITDKDGTNAVVLEPGKYYTAATGSASGVIEQDTAPEGNAGFLTYDNGVLTVYAGVAISGTMSIASDLTVQSGPQGGGLVLLGSAGPALSLNGHTLTLDSAMNLAANSIPPSTACAIEGGTIQYSSRGESGRITISGSMTGGIAAKDLTVRNAANVQISGSTNTGGVVGNLIVVNSNVSVQQQNPSNPTIVDENQIMTDTPVLLQRPDLDSEDGDPITEAIAAEDGKIWAYGGEATTTRDIYIDEEDITANTCWMAGDGMIYYESAGAGDTAKLTLDNASYEGRIVAYVGSTEVVLTGENQIREIFADQVTLTGSGSFAGTIYVEDGFTSKSTGELNAVVEEPVVDDKNSQIGLSLTVYGERSTADIFPDSPVILDENVSLTIAPGATLTVIDNEDGTPGLMIFNTSALINQGALVNNETVWLVDSAAQGDVSAYIKSLNLTGSGTVQVAGIDENGDAVLEATYTNTGKRLLDPAGEVDLSNPDNPPEDGADKGYSWNAATKTLTLLEGFNAEKVILPDDTVKIVTEGESIIGTLTHGDNPQKANLTLSGTGKLTVQEPLNISGGNDLSLTVDAGAQVEALKGVSVSASGGADAVVTVNGTLTARAGTQDGDTAVIAGQVVVGSGGVLNVYGETGVQLNGINSESGKTFVGAFTLQEDGTLYADCTKYVIAVYSGTGNAFDPPVQPNEAISIPEGYIPQGHEPKLTDDKQSIVIEADGPLTISKRNVPQPSHTHNWAAAWTTNSTHHWHECAASGCPVTENSGKNGYGEHVYDNGQDKDCNVCGYTRTVTPPEPSEPSEPSKPSEPSGPSKPSGSSGGGRSSSTYAITVEKSEHGKVTANRTRASSGSTVVLTVNPDSGYVLDVLTVTDSRENEIRLTTQNSGKYTFTMPSRAVTVRASFVPLPDETQKPCDGGADCPSRGFTDLGGVGTWYHEAVDYVLRNGLMNGYSNGTFSPNGTLTRAQFTQILFNREGRPVVNYLLQYSDVAEGAWYTEAIRWATSRGIVVGYGNGMFGPNDSITREQLAVMLWRYDGSPAATDKELHFTDADKVSGYALEALCWAVENGVISGYGDGHLAPQGLATRAQAAQMFMNFLKK